MRVTVGMVVHAGATYCPRFCGSVELKAKILLREREDAMKLGVIGIPERFVGNHASFILVIGMLSSVKLDAINRRRHSAHAHKYGGDMPSIISRTFRGSPRNIVIP